MTTPAEVEAVARATCKDYLQVRFDPSALDAARRKEW
jgi:hypothetical protein